MTEIKYTEEDLKFRVNLATDLSRMEGKIDTLRAELSPIIKLQAVVIDHDRQINKWKGVNAALGAGFMAAVTLLGAKFKHLW